MRIETARFGDVDIEPEDILLFPQGVMAFEDLKHWVLLADDHVETIGWLQCVTRPEIALAVASPRRYAPGYQVQVKRSQVQPLELGQEHQAFVLAVLNKEAEEYSLNLRAPLIINLDRRIGRQVVTTDEQPIRFVLGNRTSQRRKIA